MSIVIANIGIKHPEIDPLWIKYLNVQQENIDMDIYFNQKQRITHINQIFGKFVFKVMHYSGFLINCGIPCRTSEFNLVVISSHKPLISLTQPALATRQTFESFTTMGWGTTMDWIININRPFDAFKTLKTTKYP